MLVSAKSASKRIADSLAIMDPNAQITTQYGYKANKTAQQYFDCAAKEPELASYTDKANEAQLVGEFGHIMDSDLAQSTIMTQNYGPYIMEIWPIVTAWYPEFPLKDLISVQSMDRPLAYLFFSTLLTGTAKSPTAVGDKVETPLGYRTINGKYPTGEVMGENIPASQVEFQLSSLQSVSVFAYSPLNVTGDYLQKVLIKISSTNTSINGTYTALSYSGNKIILTKDGTNDSGHYLDIEAGAIYIKEATGATATTITGIVANYVWNIEYAQDDTIPNVKENIEMVSMEAIPRAIAMKWTVFSEYLKKSQFGIDIREDNTKRILNLMYQFQVRYILDDLYTYAQGTPATITIPSATTMSVDVKAQEVIKALKLQATRIEVTSGRMEGNRIVCGKNFKSFVESLPSTLFKPTPQPSGFSSPREIGKFSTFTVYYDQLRGDSEAFMTYRGTEWYDAAYYMGIYMPIVPTDCISLNVEVREAFASMECYKYHKKNCVIPLTIQFA